jgi:hypothetical protein
MNATLFEVLAWVWWLGGVTVVVSMAVAAFHPRGFVWLLGPLPDEPGPVVEPHPEGWEPPAVVRFRELAAAPDRPADVSPPVPVEVAGLDSWDWLAEPAGRR